MRLTCGATAGVWVLTAMLLMPGTARAQCMYDWKQGQEVPGVLGDVLVGTSNVAADLDGDCDVDGDDFTLFNECATGPDVLYEPLNLSASCTLMPDDAGLIAADLDADGDVDVLDFGRLQRCLSGEGAAADPSCTD